MPGMDLSERAGGVAMVHKAILPGDLLIRTRPLLAAVLVGTIGLAAVLCAQSYFDTMRGVGQKPPN